MIKGNKGEWSELYVLVSLLADGKLYQSDIFLQKDLENVYDVISGYKSEAEYLLEFERSDEIILYKIENENKTLLNTYSYHQLREMSNVLREGIEKGKGLSFGIIGTDDFLANAQIKKLKAPATVKADINLKIYDHRLAKATNLGFSIKSLLGGNSTLFNTGKGNNFIYKVNVKLGETVSEFNSRTYSPSGNISKITHRLHELENKGASFVFEKIQSHQLWKNLKMIDGDLPEILAWAQYYKWTTRNSSIVEVVKILEERDPLNFYDGKESAQKLYEYKLKRFLTEAAMGMTSEKPWMGEYDSFGGVIIAKQDGDIVCFHIYDFNLFRNYLIDNTMFEQAGTGEDSENPGQSNPNSGKNYNYGWLYEDNEELFFKINLQIRFK